MDQILHLDHELFYLINNEWHHPFFDSIFPWWRDKKTWIPLYLLIMGFTIFKFKVKAVYFILAVILTVSIADISSSHLIKKTVKRARPCNDTSLEKNVVLLVNCGRSYSFTSSHATNHFAIAVFIALTLGRIFRRIKLPFLLWAGSIAYGQVYVGAHFPIDVLCGAILGSLIGYFMAKLYLRNSKFSLQPAQPNIA